MRQYGKNIAVTGRPQMKIWRMRIAGWIPKATSTHTEFTKNQNQQEVKQSFLFGQPIYIHKSKNLQHRKKEPKI